MVDATHGHEAHVEFADAELYHPRSWWTKYVFSQDAKVIAIQYSATATGIGSPETGKLATALAVSPPQSSCCSAVPVTSRV